ISEIAVAYDESRTALNRALIAEFADDLKRWDAEILPDNTVRFREPDVLFDVNSASIKVAFRSILDDFFPRYISILERPEFQSEVSEIRIEGHTSSDWQGASDPGEVYIKNAKLSQDRSFSVLDYVFKLQSEAGETRDWLVTVLRANGLSYAVPVLQADGREDTERSRRVEFRVLTRTEDKIYRILQETGDAA
ncbi:MAG: hypothetical protein AAF499_03405, partial [Pseudomonadota bacterium]